MSNRPVILIADDEEINIEILLTILGDAYEVKVAYNGQQALKIISKLPIEFALLDINMPKLSGFEVAQSMQQSPELAKIPFVFLTGHNDTAMTEQGLALGAQSVLPKPFDRQVILDAVNHGINR